MEKKSSIEHIKLRIRASCLKYCASAEALREDGARVLCEQSRMCETKSEDKENENENEQ